MSELAERLPVVITLDELQEDNLVRVLTEPENSIIKEYQLLFEKDGINLLFENEALHEIARMTFANKTGARGLRTILEDILLDIMYDVPNMENISTCVIARDMLTTKVPILIEVESASDSVSEQCVF